MNNLASGMAKLLLEREQGSKLPGSDEFNREWAEMKNEFARREAEQEREAYTAKMRRDEALEQQLPLSASEPAASPSMLKDLKLIFAGNAYFTIRNSETGNRFTYHVQKSKPNERFPNPIHFISVLTGPDNTASYSFLGQIYGERKYKHNSSRSHVTEDAQSVQVVKWLMRVIENGLKLPPQIEIWHEGRCCRCGRMLTVPESIELGLGPECAGRI